jgi:hypothetical protein
MHAAMFSRNYYPMDTNGCMKNKIKSPIRLCFPNTVVMVLYLFSNTCAQVNTTLHLVITQKLRYCHDDDIILE